MQRERKTLRAMKKRIGGDNAFDMMMKKKPREQAPPSAQKSRFLACPACKHHVPEHQLNKHLDVCLVSSSNTSTESHTGTSLEAADSAQAVTNSTVRDGVKEDFAVLDSKLSPDDDPPASQHLQPTLDSPPAAGTISPESGSNVFSLMMKQSHRVFCNTEPLRQQFHLHSDGRLSWTCISGEEAPTTDFETKWSSKVTLKASRMLHGDSSKMSLNGPQPRDVELTISSSITSITAPTRLVTRHSRLSVPVLKSILQKSIRRRRPLPAVRVAMELHDKALGELLRRLPIIILEDSILHPDLPFLVWIMVAESKDYVVPPRLMRRVLCAIYEMTSCPWTDIVGNDASQVRTNDCRSDSTKFLSLSSPWFPDAENGNDGELLLRSILLRAQYGGMAGDVEMLHRYAGVWTRRLLEGRVPTALSKRINPTPTVPPDLNWADIPTVVHARPRRQSSCNVTPLVQAGLQKLSHQDICLAGVDFHCSAVLDAVIDGDAEKCIWEGLCAIVILAGLSPVPTGKEKRRSYLVQVMKMCMWKFSSGVNYRRPFVSETAEEASEGDAALKWFWDQQLASRVETFAKNYVDDRLAQ